LNVKRTAAVVFVLTLGILLLFVNEGFAQANKDPDVKGDVTMSVSNCWLDVDVHGTVDLGSFDSSSSFGDTVSGTGDVTTNSSCPNGYSLSVEVTGLSHTNTTDTDFILDDFEWAVDVTDSSGIHDQADDVTTNWSGFTQLNDQIKVGDMSAPANVTWPIEYQYTYGQDDVQGTYTVTLQYTATAS